MTDILTLTTAELDALRQVNSPTISNAIELFNVRPRNVGFLDSRLKCMFPDFGAMVGYATTVTIMANQPAPKGAPTREAYWEHVLSIPAPRIAVVLDLDNPQCVGSFWGEVNSSVHRALGCVGTITEGGVRDLDEMKSIGFQTLAVAPIVSHAYVHIENFGIPVKVGGVVITPGDLIHADQHGAIVIPKEIAKDVAAAAHELDSAERILINEALRLSSGQARSGKATLASLAQANTDCRAALEAVAMKYARR